MSFQITNVIIEKCYITSEVYRLEYRFRLKMTQVNYHFIIHNLAEDISTN